jgi:hypothetical protein
MTVEARSLHLKLNPRFAKAEAEAGLSPKSTDHIFQIDMISNGSSRRERYLTRPSPATIAAYIGMKAKKLDNKHFINIAAYKASRLGSIKY